MLKKSLGQHLLTNKGVIQKIAKDALLHVSKKSPWLLEVGPGAGALTEELLLQGAFVCAVEIDPDMIEILRNKFQKEEAEGRFKIIRADASKLDSQSIQGLPIQSICGNLPYNRAADICFYFYENFLEIKHFCFLMQKEVTQRFIATFEEKAYGPTSILWSSGTQIGSSFLVKPGSFMPPPLVDSMNFQFSRAFHNEGLAPHLEAKEYFEFKKFLKKAFQQRRKKIKNNLSCLKGTTWESFRAEEINPLEYKKLFQEYWCKRN